MEYIRETYGVPAKRGMKVIFTGCTYIKEIHGVILSAKGGYLRIRKKNGVVGTFHPTRNLIYLEES